MGNNMITLQTCRYFTAQAVFDTVAIHLLSQVMQSIDKTNSQCLYHAPDGLKCAVGCLIPEDHTYFNLEHLNVSQLLGSPDHVHFDLLLRLQSVHDEDVVKLNWKAELIDLANELRLNTDAVIEM
jgi:hypothetical protein